jgi:hypothetical protein
MSTQFPSIIPAFTWKDSKYHEKDLGICHRQNVLVKPQAGGLPNACLRAVLLVYIYGHIEFTVPDPENREQ